ncbi:MAG: ABC transporter permease [Lachnospiraceae bacterium]|nr:ABC transporter permease [Lachnospiraceae bacterium]
MREAVYLKIKSLIPATIMLVLLSVVFSVNSPYFFSIKNFINIVTQTATMSILAIGLTFVVIGGCMDLSGGSVIALVSVACGELLTAGLPVPLVFLAGLALGAIVGLFNGFCVAKLGMHSFVMTLSTSIMVKGIAFALSGGGTIYGLPDTFLCLGSGKIGSLPVPVLLVLILFPLFQVILGHTVFGYHVYAVGENARGAEMTGIRADRVRVTAFVLAGILYALAAIVLTGQLGAAVSTSGEDMEMTALACLAIGGVSITGGRGSLMGTLLGCLIIGVLTNGVNLLNLSPYYTDFIQGLVIYGALFIECSRVLLQRRRRTNRGE